MTEKKLKHLPLGISTFAEIIQKNYIYVDKTKHIFHLITGGKYYFLSRPRRFGKSLLVSTLGELFAENRDLFKYLWIGQNNYDWQQHPIIKIDFSGIDYSENERLEQSLKNCLRTIAQHYNVRLTKTESAKDLFGNLIDQLSHKNSVVLLIDEYDKPIIDNMHNLKKAEEQRTILQNFYSTIKAKDAHLRFVLLTGVSKFAKTSIFSGLNNLEDITLDGDYATLLGYTEAELVTYFSPHIELLAHKIGRSFSQTLDELRDNYDGYLFASQSTRVFNPYSILSSLKKKALAYYWFESGTPTFLIKLLQKNDYDLESITNPTLNEGSLGNFEPESIPLPSLLLQTGYLTIKERDPRTNNYTLCIPNKEVRNGLTLQLADAFTLLPANKSIQHARVLMQAFSQNDMADLHRKLQDFFNRMPYTIHIQNEHELQFVLYAIFALIGVTVDPEVTTSLGRADLVVSLPKHVYIIELKFNQPAHKALQQIQEKRYYEKYINSSQYITLLGIGFDKQTKTISLEWQHLTQTA